jgi:hypothetical protein
MLLFPKGNLRRMTCTVEQLMNTMQHFCLVFELHHLLEPIVKPHHTFPHTNSPPAMWAFFHLKASISHQQNQGSTYLPYFA